MKDYVEFFNGKKMPVVGLGTWQASNPEELEKALDAALEAGYRHIDTAYMYQNEAVIGRVLKKWLDSGKIKREELFIVTKLPMIGMRPHHVGHFVNLQLKSLQLDYIDLYLVHCPVGFTYISDQELVPIKDGKVQLDMATNLEAIWKAMEAQVDKGLVKSIGISNFSESQIERIMKVAKIQPANIQVELHAYYQQKALRKVCAKHNITVCAYAPIGSPGRKQLYESRGAKFEPLSLLEDPVVVDIANRLNKTAAQILLRFLAQHQIAVIPKSTNPERLKQNLQILDFELTQNDIYRLTNLDKGAKGRSFDGALFKGMAEHPEAAPMLG